MKTKIILSMLLLLSSITSYSQNFIYSYDAAGNRIKRALPATRMANVRVATDTAFIDDGLIAVEEENVAEEANISDLSSEIFSTIIYPNPTSGYFTLELPDYESGEKVQLLVYSEGGRTVLNEHYSNFSRSFDISAQPSGFYILKIIVGKRMVLNKIIKE